MPVTTVMTTDEVAPEERFAYWREAICDVFVQLDAEPVDDAPFDGTIVSSAIGSVELSDVVADAQHVERSPRQISKAREDLCLVSLQTAGVGLISQDGRSVLLRPGDFALYDATRPYTLDFRASFGQLVYQFPRASLVERGVDLPHVTARSLRGKGAGIVVADFLRSLGATGADVAPDAAPRIANHTLDLLATAIASAMDALPEPDSLRAYRRRRVLTYISDHLTEHDLSITTIAEGLGISVRTVHKLFEGDDLTVGRRILAARLERCRRDLRDPLHRHPSITEIAMRNGFRDSAHFSRCFKRAYGTTPRDYRRDPNA